MRPLPSPVSSPAQTQLHTPLAFRAQAVRNKALMQYATPFSALDLNGMAAFFNTSVGCAPPWLAARPLANGLLL